MLTSTINHNFPYNSPSCHCALEAIPKLRKAFCRIFDPRPHLFNKVYLVMSGFLNPLSSLFALRNLGMASYFLYQNFDYFLVRQ